jgi:hypothetical protein
MSDTPLARRLVAPGLAVVAVAAIAVSAVLIGRHQPGGGTVAEPPPLRLVDVGAGAASAADRVAGPPTFTVPLPTGPDRQQVRVLPKGAAPQAAVVRLARALGLSGEPLRTDHGWQLTGDGRRLTVTDTAGWPWTLGPPVRVGGPIRCHVIDRQRGPLCPGPGVPPITVPPPNPVLPNVLPDGGARSAPATTGPIASAVPVPATPLPPPSRPTDAEALAAARPVLSALGLGAAPTHVQRIPGQVQVLAEPVVDGLPTSGFETRLEVDTRQQVTDGTGWLGTPTAGPEYPLVNAAEALARVPVPAIAVPCGSTSCPRPEVVGARLGLALRWDTGGQPLLVPAWLYEVRGQTAPLVAVAVDPRYLVHDKPSGPTAGGSGGSAGSGTAGQPGVVTPAPSTHTR